MNIEFVVENDGDLQNRRNRYLDPNSELSGIMLRVQDAIESSGFSVDRSKYKFVAGKLCKFQMEIISAADIKLLTKRSVSLSRIRLNIAKLKWEWSTSGQSYSMRIGTVGDKDIQIVVVNLASIPSEDDRVQISALKDGVIRGSVEPDTPPAPVVIAASVTDEPEEPEEPDEKDESEETDGEEDTDDDIVSSPSPHPTIVVSAQPRGVRATPTSRAAPQESVSQATVSVRAPLSDVDRLQRQHNISLARAGGFVARTARVSASQYITARTSAQPQPQVAPQPQPQLIRAPSQRPPRAVTTISKRAFVAQTSRNTAALTGSLDAARSVASFKICD